MPVKDTLLQVLKDAKYIPHKNQIQSLCPFHQEKTPSFFVDLNLKVYHCFGCGAKGTLLDLLKHLNLDYTYLLLDKLNQPQQTNKHLIYIHNQPQKQSALKNKYLRRYLKRRHITEPIIKLFNLKDDFPYILIPYTIPKKLYYYLLNPLPPDNLTKQEKLLALTFKKKINNERTNLILPFNNALINKHSKHNKNKYNNKNKRNNMKIKSNDKDKMIKIRKDMRMLLINMINDIHNEIEVGFISRLALNLGERPYIRVKNSPTLPRRLSVFGLTKIRDFNERIFIVEGPFDVLRLTSEGLQSIALLGKEITREQRILLRFIQPKKIAIALDGDAFESALKLYKILRGDLPDTEIELYKLPEKKDPGDLGRKVLDYKYFFKDYLNDLIF